MKTMVVYSSLTGNTKMIAEIIHGELDSAEIHHVVSAPAPDAYDLIFVGFWVDKGHADANALKYMEKIHGKKVAVFFTLGAYPDSEHADAVFEHTKAQLGDNEVIGHFRCLGRVDPRVLEAMRHMPNNPHKDTPERRARLAEAEKHPDETDRANAAAFAARIMAEI
jgi:flavodoxin